MEKIPRSKEIRERNVECVEGENRVRGTLILRSHHLIFSFTSESSSQQSSGPSTPKVSQDSSATPDTRKPAAPVKLRAKELYYPYPLINSCVLRPSQTQGARYQDLDPDRNGVSEDNNELFPPTYGTSSTGTEYANTSIQAPYASSRRPATPVGNSAITASASASGRDPVIRIGTRDFKKMLFIFHGDGRISADNAARRVFYCIRDRCCVERVQELYAFHFKAPHEEIAADLPAYDARREFARMGIGAKASEGHGSAWRISSINQDYTFSPTYPSVLCVPAAVSDNLLKYGGPYRSKSRIPALTYLHSNGGSITRSSQPMPGLAGKRNPQDERLVSAIFSSHTSCERLSDEVSTQDTLTDVPAQKPEADSQAPGGTVEEIGNEPKESVDAEPKPKIYGTTRKNFIVDARPRLNALANRATGGGIEDVANYCGPNGQPPERVFLDIANIHVMRKSLAKIIDNLGSAECSHMPVNHEGLARSGWLGHIAGLLDGSEKIARAVGLGGDHVLLHCSDGWDRTSQVAAIAEVMLDPYYRTIAGFVALVQKDFLSFGHKFNHRHGILGCEKWFDIENERVTPPQGIENAATEATFGSKAFSGAKNWFEKNRNGLFRQQNESRGSLEESRSRPPSPPANPVLHAPATTSTAKDREHKVKEDEIAPIFHQFLDAIFQILYEYPDAFEFNEKFLVRLLYHAYSCQYGEFLFNNERERAANEHLFPSIWSHFLARRGDFTNPSYAPKAADVLLLPRRTANRTPAVRWWSSVFRRKDQDMNTPASLALAAASQQYASSLHEETSDSTSFESLSHKNASPAANGVMLSTGIGNVRDSITSTFSSLQVGSNGQQNSSSLEKTPLRPALEQRETDHDVLAAYANASEVVSADNDAQMRPQVVEQPVQNRLDVSAFAQGSAYTDR